MSALVPGKDQYRHIDQEYDGCDHSVRSIRSIIVGKVPSETSVNDTKDDHASTEPSMQDTENGSPASLVIMKMLVETHGWLEENKHGYYDEANGLMIAVYFTQTVPKHNAETHADDEEDRAQHLQRRMDESDFLCGRQVQGERG